MMHLLRKYDAALLRLAMMRCLPLCARRHTSLGVAVIIGFSLHHLRDRQTSLKKDQVTSDLVFFLAAELGYSCIARRFFALPLTSELDALCGSNANPLLRLCSGAECERTSSAATGKEKSTPIGSAFVYVQRLRKRYFLRFAIRFRTPTVFYTND